MGVIRQAHELGYRSRISGVVGDQKALHRAFTEPPATSRSLMESNAVCCRGLYIPYFFPTVLILMQTQKVRMPKRTNAYKPSTSTQLRLSDTNQQTTSQTTLPIVLLPLFLPTYIRKAVRDGHP